MRLHESLIWLALGALAGAGCVSGNKIRAAGEVIQADIEHAHRLNAQRCAPRELALAEANLDFAYGEVTEGDSPRAQEHIAIAEENAKKALLLSKDCGPKQAPAKEKEVVLKIADRDGDGVPDAEDQCPDVPGPKENFGCPEDKDTDGDGIPDSLDRCPNDPEDKDGFQDDDGCPDNDNDGDGIADKLDACPNVPGPIENQGCPIVDRDGDGILDWDDACPDEPGVPDPDPKKNGCPRKLSLVVVKKDRIEIKKQINFAFGKAAIQGAESFKILDEVVQVLNDTPAIQKLRVEGHTDSVGSAEANERLSQARAEACVAYLLSQGIAAKRMEAMGFGKARPIASNATDKGRAQNRRTEFNIVERQ